MLWLQICRLGAFLEERGMCFQFLGECMKYSCGCGNSVFSSLTSCWAILEHRHHCTFSQAASNTTFLTSPPAVVIIVLFYFRCQGGIK